MVRTKANARPSRKSEASAEKILTEVRPPYKRADSRWTEKQIAMFFEEYQKSEYPSGETLAMLAKKTKSDPVTIRVWFQGRRSTDRRRELNNLRKLEQAGVSADVKAMTPSKTIAKRAGRKSAAKAVANHDDDDDQPTRRGSKRSTRASRASKASTPVKAKTPTKKTPTKAKKAATTPTRKAATPTRRTPTKTTSPLTRRTTRSSSRTRATPTRRTVAKSAAKSPVPAKSTPTRASRRAGGARGGNGVRGGISKKTGSTISKVVASSKAYKGKVWDPSTDSFVSSAQIKRSVATDPTYRDDSWSTYFNQQNGCSIM